MHEELALKAEVLTAISDITALDWDTCSGSNPFLKHAFLLALEQSGSATSETGWHPLHIKLTNTKTGQAVGFMPLYVKSHSYGEYVFDHAWANAFENAGGQYYPKLQSCVPFTPVTGSRLLVAPNAPPGTARMLLQSAKTLVNQQQFSSLHITFATQGEAEIAREQGLLIRADQQFHWQNDNYECFDDFLEQLSSRKRKQIKKERRVALESGVNIQTLEGTDIQLHHWDAFFAFYLDTSTKKWGQPYLNRQFFNLIGSSMSQDIVMVMCEHKGRFVAGALNFKSDKTLYGRYWGCLEELPCLHFEACYYQAIDYAIKNKLKTVEAGAQGPHKLARGYVPTLTYSAHWIENPGFRNAIAQFLEHERQNVDAEIEYLSERTPFKTQ